MISKIDRYKGALIGLHAGDALGAPYETWSADKVREDMERRGGLVPFDYPNPWAKESPKICPMGRPTDDSDHAAALAESLIANRGINQADLFYRLRRVVFGHVSPLWSGPAFGAGSTTRNALRPATWEESRARPYDEGKEYPSNGSLMRTAPMALFAGNYPMVRHKDVLTMSQVTHRHPHAGIVCVVFAEMLASILDGFSSSKAVWRASHYAGDDIPGLSDGLDDAVPAPRDPEEWPGRGAAVLTLHVAVWSLRSSSDFRDGLTKAVAIGGDTDTYAAVAGALLGARYGYEGIPPEWRECLLGHDKMVELAESLYHISQSR
jgi:ADP-ribosyl-[dinitrogen reductase] hydrolase